jgi:hypothetical protein
MESFKQLVQAVQMCQSALRVPEEVMPNLAICRTALRLQQEASQLQHVAIQQCNILQVRCPPRLLPHCLVVVLFFQVLFRSNLQYWRFYKRKKNN